MGKVKENVQRQVTISLVVTLLGVQFASETKTFAIYVIVFLTPYQNVITCLD